MGGELSDLVPKLRIPRAADGLRVCGIVPFEDSLDADILANDVATPLYGHRWCETRVDGPGAVESSLATVLDVARCAVRNLKTAEAFGSPWVRIPAPPQKRSIFVAQIERARRPRRSASTPVDPYMTPTPEPSAPGACGASRASYERRSRTRFRDGRTGGAGSRFSRRSRYGRGVTWIHWAPLLPWVRRGATPTVVASGEHDRLTREFAEIGFAVLSLAEPIRSEHVSSRSHASLRSRTTTVGTGTRSMIRRASERSGRASRRQSFGAAGSHGYGRTSQDSFAPWRELQQ